MNEREDAAETIVIKALDGEALSERELRDFGAALIARPELAEQYALARRIQRDAADVPRPVPAPGFADRVMDAVEALPRHGRTATPVKDITPTWATRPARAPWQWVAGLVTALLLGAAGWLEAAKLVRPFEWLATVDWTAWPAGLGREARALLPGPGLIERLPFALGSLLWLAALLCLAAIGLNAWLIGQPERFRRQRRTP